MKRYAFATAVLLLVVSPWRQAPQADVPAFTVEALGTSASIGSFVPAETGINASGEIVGTVTDNTPAANTRAVRYTPGIGWEYVPGLTWGSTAQGINVYGDIVGYRVVGTKDHAYRYNAATGTIDDILPLTAGRSSFGFGINDNGDVVGQTDVSLGVFRAFIARVGQNPVQLPSLGGSSDLACAINNVGQVAETSGTGGQHAARVEADGVTILDAGTFDGTSGMSGACAIDDLGHIGGFTSAKGFAEFHAYRWDPGHPVKADAGLPSTFGNVESISGGVSAGWYQLADGSTHALRHTDVDGAIDLNTLLPSGSGWVLSEVKGINASGQMVGDGFLNGVATVFLMSPSKPKDTTPPVIAPHADVTAEAAGPGGAVVSYTVPSTTDNVDGPGTATCAPASGSNFALGSTAVTCNATDAAGNAATPTTFNVVVQDTTAPVIAAHGDLTAEATGPKGAGVTYSAPTTSDAVDGSGTATCAPASGSTFALGATTVNCTATDAAGNAAAPTSFSVVVKDTTPPVIAPHADVTAEVTGPLGATVAYTAPATSDLVDGAGTATCTPASGSTFAPGTTTVTCNASDAAGNAATATVFNVIVRDTTAPVILGVTANPSTIWPPNGGMVTVNVTINATDNSGVVGCRLANISGPGTPGVDYLVTGIQTGSVRAVGGSMYTFTAQCVDKSGNASSASTTVFVTPDTTAPVISMVYASPDAIWPPNGKMVPVSVMVTASDDVDATPSCALTSINGGATTDSAITGQFSAQVRANAGATYALTVTCSDRAGNASTASANVTVTKTNGNSVAPKAKVGG